ncbi:phosphatase 2C-like domain-containing protein [Tribonema minus]|uniref:Phosphatase 2C-like domain-containing protein n=1 Tax=Tribonema minus TaxID=303371 RepID=A0A835YK53_9STRA|nr:phosphatase 2C-like domain-containing protein [Tribonema minus]
MRKPGRVSSCKVNLKLGVRFGHFAEQGSRDSMEDRTVAIADIFQPLWGKSAATEHCSRFFPAPTSGTWSRDCDIEIPEEEGDVGGAYHLSGAFTGCASAQEAQWRADNCHRGHAAYFGVYDGHGGDSVAEALQAQLHRAIVTHQAFHEDRSRAILEATYDVDMQCLSKDYAARQETARNAAAAALERSTSKPSLLPALLAPSGARTAGSVAVLAVVYRSLSSAAVVVHVAHVGDCRCVVGRGGRAVALTSDHKPARKDEAQRVEAAGGYVSRGCVNGVLRVTRSFGDIHCKVFPPRNTLSTAEGPAPLASDGLWGSDQQIIAKPELCTFEVSPEDEFMILASDGIWDVVHDQGAVNFVQRRLFAHRDVQRASKELADKAATRSTDNCSCIIVCLNQQAPNRQQ